MPLTPPTAPDPPVWHKIVHEGGILESWDDDGPAATVLYRCQWDERYDFASALMGGYPPGADGFSSYMPPHQYPPSPNMWCKKITGIRGEGALKAGKGSKWLSYTYALVTAQYGLSQFDYSSSSGGGGGATPAGQIDIANPILYCRQRIRTSSAFEVLGKRKLKFSTSGKLVDAEATRPAVQTEITLEFPRVPFNPYLLVRPYVGKISTVEMWGHPTGGVLLDGCETDLSGTFAGMDVGVVLTYLCRDTSWNTLVNDEGDHELVQYVDSSPAKRPIDEINHFSLFS